MKPLALLLSALLFLPAAAWAQDQEPPAGEAPADETPAKDLEEEKRELEEGKKEADKEADKAEGEAHSLVPERRRGEPLDVELHALRDGAESIAQDRREQVVAIRDR